MSHDLPSWKSSYRAQASLLAPIQEELRQVARWRERGLTQVAADQALNSSRVRQRAAPSLEHKGCLYATQPDDNSRGDFLFFRFYPETLPYDIKTQLVSETVPGRSFPSHQNLGGGGLSINLQLRFYDAFMSYSPSEDDLTLKARAARAYSWLALYCLGHDGTGRSIPDVDIYLQLGNSPAHRVVIKGVAAQASMFGVDDLPQMLEAEVQVEYTVPQEFVSPFRPKKPKATRRVATKPCVPLECAPCPDTVVPAPGLPADPVQSAKAAVTLGFRESFKSVSDAGEVERRRLRMEFEAMSWGADPEQLRKGTW